MPAGKLFVVGTPIGNLADMTYRAVETLASADVVACENRDRHLKLLNHYNIHKRLIEISPANEANGAKGVVKLIAEGNVVALVSDAGMPTVSDPGRTVVSAVREAGFAVEVVPGASAFTTILAASGWTSTPSAFLGFLSKKTGKIERELESFKGLDGTLVLFVSQFQARKVLEAAAKVFPDSQVCIGREMTKVNEEFIFGTAAELLDKGFVEKGEFTMAIKVEKFKKILD